MDKIIEEKIVKKFIEKMKSDRVIFELSNEKKRSDCIRKLPSILKTNGKQFALTNDEQIYQTLFAKRKVDLIYVISDDRRIDGTYQNAESALEHALSGSSTYILFFAFAIFIKEEVGYSAPKYILLLE